MKRQDWPFERYLYEIEYLAELSEIPELAGLLAELVAEMKERYPADCKEFGIQ